MLKNRKGIKAILCSLLAALASVCLIAALAVLPNLGAVSVKADDTVSTAEQFVSQVESAAAYSSEKVISLGDATATNQSFTLTSTDGITVGAAKTVRVTGAKKLIISSNLTIEPEANLILDVETQVSSGAEITVNGTLTVNGRLYNAGTVIAANKYSANDELPSSGVVVNGSFNNDGTITVNEGSLFTTAENANYTQNKQTAITANGGALFIKSGTATGTITNNGSVIYSGSAPSVTGSGATVKATFYEATLNNLKTAVTEDGTYVFYGSNGADVSVEIGNDISIANAVNLLSFGKVTFKLSTTATNKTITKAFTVSSNVSLGGGVDSSKIFTQGANELIFDGGAVWTADSDADKDGQYDYVKYTSSKAAHTIFYDNNNVPHKYDNSSSGVKNSSTAFFNVTSGSFSTYGGTKLTNYHMTGGANIGGGVKVVSGTSLNMYGGEISWCAVTGSTNDGSGAGIYCKGGTVNIYGGLVTHNALGNSGQYSADGAGISIDSASGGVTDNSYSNAGILNMYGGEVSYNHGALENEETGADGGGIMMRYSIMNMYDGKVSGNFTGGSGGGVNLWVSKLVMYAGEISGNHAVYGGGIGVVGWTKDSGYDSIVDLKGGSIVGNNAIRNYTKKEGNIGGYGGGICVGSSYWAEYATLNVSGDVLISGNKAYYGGGLAVYTNDSATVSNMLNMTGGLISGNAAYTLPDSADGYYDTYDSPVSSNGGGVYVYAKALNNSRPMLNLSGTASIDSSNSVSFNVALKNGQTIGNSYASPINVGTTTVSGNTSTMVAGSLTGSGLGALVCLNSTALNNWKSKNIVSNGATYLNKFVIDNEGYTLAKTGANIQLAASTTEVIAKVFDESGETEKSSHTTLSDAIAKAGKGDIIEIQKSTTISDGGLIIDKDLTIRPVKNADITVVVAAEATNYSGALFTVNGNVTFTLDANGGRLTFDGNGNGRALAGNGSTFTFVDVLENGQFIQNKGVYLRNNETTARASAVTVGRGATYELNGGVIENNSSSDTAGTAVYFNVESTFKWNGGKITDNTSLNAPYNYGLYFSASSCNVTINGTVSLKNNVIYSPATKIVVGKGFATDDNEILKIILPADNNLVAGFKLVYITQSTASKFEDYVSERFTVESVIDGLYLGTIAAVEDSSDAVLTSDISHVIVVRRTTTYILDASADGVTKPALDNVDDLIDALTKQYGAIDVKTRNFGLTLVIKVSSANAVDADGLKAISDFYTYTGHAITGWSSTTHATISYSQSLGYDGNNNTSDNPVNYTAVWTANSYTLTFNVNAPQGAQSSAAVGGTASELATPLTFDYDDVQSTNYPSDKVYVKGFVFSGWVKDKDEVLFEKFGGRGIALNDLTYFTAVAGTRNNYALTVTAKWTPLFASYTGIGTSDSPFIISTAAHLQNLINTVNGAEVEVDGYTYYNSVSGNSLAHGADSYSNSYFTLASDIAVSSSIGSESAPFGGYFDGGFNTVTLNGVALFGYLSGANVSNLVLGGNVESDTADYVGALANAASGGSVSNVGNTASVSATKTGATAGGIIGKSSNGLTVTGSFNYVAVTADKVAGGIIGEAADGTGNLTSVYNTGAVSATAIDSVVGGLLGSSSITIIFYSYNGGALSGATKGAVSGGTATCIGVYYNTDKTLVDTPALGGAATSSATALTSSQMYVFAEGTAPNGMSGLAQGFSFIFGGDGNVEGAVCYYPQLTAFATCEVDAVREISANSVKLTVPAPEGSGEIDLEPEKEFTVYFNLNGGSYNGSSEDFDQKVKFKADAKVEEPTGTVSRVGYNFAGWYTAAEGGVEYNFDSGVSASDLYLYARWTEREYVFNYVALGGTMNGTYNRSITLSSGKVTLPESKDNPDDDVAKRLGYKFALWQFVSGADTYTVDSIEIVDLNVILYHGTTQVFNFPLSYVENGLHPLTFSADWNVIKYNITYKYVLAENGENLPDAEVAKITYTAELASTYDIENRSNVSFGRPSLAGYNFIGWTENLNGSWENSAEFSAIPNTYLKDFTLYGVFDPIDYNLTFDTGDGVLAYTIGDVVENRTPEGWKAAGFKQEDYSQLYYYTVTYNEAPKNLGNIVAYREGYEFLGWYLTRAENEPVYDLNSVYSYAFNRTVYAKYKIITYKITVEVDSAKGHFTSSQFAGFPDGAVEFEGETFYSYTVKVDHGSSGYAYLVTPYATGTAFSGWDNIDNIINVEANGKVTAQFATDFTVVFINSTLGETTTVNSEGGQLSQGDIDTYTKPHEPRGYTFVAWYDVATNTKVEDLANIESACVLYAQYNPAQVNVTFNLNDPNTKDSITPDRIGGANAYYYNEKFTLDSLPTATYEKGYEFAGWYFDVQGTQTAVGASISECVGSEGAYAVTLYAKWNDIQYDITYNWGASDVTLGTAERPTHYTYAQTFDENRQPIPVDNVATRDGYVLSGWEGTDENNKIIEGTTGTLVLVAKWTPKTYTVTFDAGEGSFTVPNGNYAGVYKAEDGTTATAGDAAKTYVLTVTHGTAATAPVNPVREGYLFSSWGSLNNITADSNFTATYTPQAYKLYFINNGARYAERSVQYLSNLPAETGLIPTQTGYDFLGWFDSADDSANEVISVNNGALSTSATMPAGDLSLYAHWAKKNYKLTFICDDADQADITSLLNAALNKTPSDGAYTVQYGDELGALNGINSSNKTLVFYTDEAKTAVYTFSVATGDVKVYAVLSNNITTYVVTFNHGDGTTREFSYVIGAKINLYTPVRNGYTFVKWIDESENEVAENTVVTSNVTYTAVWSGPIEYTIHYVLGLVGANNNTDNKEVYTVASDTITLQNATREGYTFLGWYDGTAGTTKVTAINTGSTGDRTLFARWKVNTYTITFKGYKENSADGETVHDDLTVTLTYGDSIGHIGSYWVRAYHDVTVKFADTETDFEQLTAATVPALEKVYAGRFTEGTGDNVGVYAATVNISYVAKTNYIKFYKADGTPDGLTDASTQYSYGVEKIISADSHALEGDALAGNTHIGWNAIIGNNTVKVAKLILGYNGVTVYTANGQSYSYTQEEVRLYPDYERTKYQVMFDLNGGTGSMDNQTFEYGEYLALKLYDGTKTGYSFAGWSTNVSGTPVEYANGAMITSTATDTVISLYAVWTPIVYTIVFDFNYEVTPSSSSYQVTIENNTVTLINVSRTGYTLIGWKLSVDDTARVPGTTLTVGTDIISQAVNNVITLKAAWTATLYTVTFDANGGKAVDTSLHLSLNTRYNAVGSLPVTTREGYVFDGWYLNDNFNAVKITDESVVTTASDHTLIARWKANVYALSFDLNGGRVNESTTVGSVNFSYDGNSGVTFNTLPTPTKSGYTFVGWAFEYIDEGGNTQSLIYIGELSLDAIINADNNYNILTKNAEGSYSVTAHAVWDQLTYTVVYVLNGGTNDDSNPSTYTVTSNDIELNAATREGYTFLGWYGGTADDAEKIEIIEQGSTTNYILYAKWAAKTYTVTVYIGRGTLAETGLDSGIYTVADNEGKKYVTFTGTHGSEIYSMLYTLQSKITANTAKESFLVWSTTEYDAEVTAISQVSPLSTFVLTDDLTIYATYSSTLVSISIIYLDGQSTVEIVNKNYNYTVDDLEAALKDHVHTGYEGNVITWKYPDTEEVQGAEWDGKLENSITLIETAQGNEYTVTLKYGYGVDDGKITVVYGSKYDLSGDECNPVRTGYTFLGWYSDENLITQVTSDTVVATADKHNLYARWVANYYTFEFQLGYDNSRLSSVMLQYSDGGSLSLSSPARAGYVFKGWQLNGAGTLYNTSVSLAQIAEGKVNNDVISFTANWTQVSYLVQFFLNDGTVVSGSAETVTKHVGNDDVILPVLERAGYTYSWIWSCGDESGAVTGGELTVSQLIAFAGDSQSEQITIRITAEWTEVSYSINYNLYGGANASSNPANYTVTSATVTLAEATRAGYAFAGWYTDIDYIHPIQKIETGSTGSVTLYASWQTISYKVEFSGEGIDTETSTITVETDNGVLSLASPVRIGYTFGGWAIAGNDNVTYNISVRILSIIEFAAGSEKTISFSAIWSDAVYTVEYVFANGEGFASDATIRRSFKYNETVLVPVPVKANYNFIGWNITPAEGEPKIVEVTGEYTISGYSSDLTLTARWSRVEHEIEVDIESFEFKQNGTPTMADGTEISANYVIMFGTPKAVPARMARMARSVPDFSFDDYDWSYDMPVNVGDYILLVYFKYDGDNTAMPTDGDETGWAIKEFSISKINNPFIVNDYEITYGDEWELLVLGVEEDALLTVTYSVHGEDEWTSVKPSSVGTYDVKVISAETRNYNATNDSVTLKINPATITVTATASGIYGDAFDASKVNYVLTGFVNDEDESVISGAPAATIASANSLGAGTHSLTVNTSAMSADNYVFSASGTYTVAKRNIEVTIADIEATYGSPVNLSNVKLTAKGLANGEVLAQVVSFTNFTTTAGQLSDVNGIYPITCDYSSANYEVTFTVGSGYYRINPLSIDLEITADGGVYGGAGANVYISDIIGDTVSSENKAALIEDLTQKTSFIYTGITFQNEVYQMPYEIPVESGMYYVTLLCSDDNYSLTTSSVQFTIAKAQNGLTEGELSIKGWTYGQYNANVNSPVSSSALAGTIVYTYSSSKNGEYTTVVPSASNAGTYWVRIEIAEQGNYTAYTSAPVSFEISKVALSVPELTINTAGDNKNDVYTGSDLTAPVVGYNSALMRIAYDGTLVADNDDVTVVAQLAGTYTVKYSLINTVNYCWADGTKLDEDGNAVKVWTVQKMKVAIPKESTEPFTLSGFVLNYLPDGFDESIMSITDNTQAFAGKYTATISLKDTDNYEWADGSVGDIELDWEIVGINKIFVAIVTTVGGLTLIAAGFAIVQLILHKRRKLVEAKAVEERSAVAEEAGTMTAIEAEANENGAKSENKEDGTEANQ